MSADNRQFSVKVELEVEKTLILKVTNQSSQLTFKLLSWGDPASERDYFQYIQPSKMCLTPGKSQYAVYVKRESMHICVCV